MLYMIIERFKGGDAVPVYKRFAEQGRLIPEGIEYINSWVADDLEQCFQVMSCNDEDLLLQWIANWDDLVDFEVIPVVTSAEAREKIVG